MQFGSNPVHLHSRNTSDFRPGAALPWPERVWRGRGGRRAEPRSLFPGWGVPPGPLPPAGSPAAQGRWKDWRGAALAQLPALGSHPAAPSRTLGTGAPTQPHPPGPLAAVSQDRQPPSAAAAIEDEEDGGSEGLRAHRVRERAGSRGRAARAEAPSAISCFVLSPRSALNNKKRRFRLRMALLRSLGDLACVAGVSRAWAVSCPQRCPSRAPRAEARARQVVLGRGHCLPQCPQRGQTGLAPTSGSCMAVPELGSQTRGRGARFLRQCHQHPLGLCLTPGQQPG